MKIAIVIHNLEGGGAEKMMMRLANSLQSLGHNVSLVLLTNGGVNKEKLDSAVTLVELQSPRTAASVSRLRKYLKEARPDRVLSALTHVNVVSYLACASVSMLDKLFCSERNAFSLDKHVNNEPLVKLAYFVAPYLYRTMPNPVIAVSQGVANDLVQTTVVPKNKVIALPNPTLDNNYLERTYGLPTHPWLINKEKPVIVGLGRLAHQKGFEYLIRSFAEVRKQFDAKLVILGEGELRNELQALCDELSISDHVDLFGYVNDPLNEINAADLFVLSSLFEGSPNALVEAMSARCKVVATSCPCGPDEILNNGKYGPLVPVKDVGKLTDAIVDRLQIESFDPEPQLEYISRYTALSSAKSYLNAFGHSNA